MARIKIQGITEYETKLTALGRRGGEIIKRGVYAGADIVADAVAEAISGIPTEAGPGGRPKLAKKGEKLVGLSPRQKADLIKGLGLSKMSEESGYINTKLGFNGYGSTPTKKYTKGVPNVLLMRSVEKGTYFRKKNPVIRRTVNRVRPIAEKAMADEVEKEIKKEI